MPFIWSRKQKPSIFDWTSDLRSYTQTGSLLDIHSLPSPPNIEIVNEYGTPIDTSTAEYPEQCLAYTYCNPNSTVLELGARYGSVSCIIGKQTSNHVCVEPDSTVWSALESNLKQNGCSANVFKGFVSRKQLSLLPMGYASMAVEGKSELPSKSVYELEAEYGLKFDTLVADCEGFLETFFDEHPGMYSQLHTVIFEADFPNKCDYVKIRNNLKQNRFTEIVHGFQNVYIKQYEVLFDTWYRSSEETIYGNTV